MRPKKKSPQDEGMKESIAQLIASYESGRSTETLRKLGDFQYTPIEFGYTPSVGDTPDLGGIADAGGIAGFALNILETILRLFIFRV